MAFEQEDVPGSVEEQEGRAGGSGAGVELNVILHSVNIPELLPFRLSCMQRFQVPSASWPLFTDPKYPSGKKDPLKGALADLIELLAVALKQVLI